MTGPKVHLASSCLQSENRSLLTTELRLDPNWVTLICPDLCHRIGCPSPSATAAPSIYRVLGYALFDYDDEYRTGRLGFYL